MAFSGAVLRESAGRLAIESLDLRNVAAGDVIVRVRASSLCHTDLEATTGALGTPLPFVPGHEAAGTVEWVGADVRQVQPGDHVVLSSTATGLRKSAGLPWGLCRDAWRL